MTYRVYSQDILTRPGTGAVQLIIDLFNNDILPIVYDKGSLGASGDLAPLANLFLPLIGIGETRYKGKKRDIEDVMNELG